MADLEAALPGYGFVGVGRADGVADGEFGPIFYRRHRFELLEHGRFWLSEHPQEVGSIGWDAALPRMATWARLRFKDAPSRELQVVNVHFDHVGGWARQESARMVRGLASSLGARPVLVLGDFNCDPSSEPYQTLTANTAASAGLRDAFADSPDSGGTYHAFTGIAEDGRIDWILFNSRLECLEAAVDRRSFDGGYPSDHFPVVATLRREALRRTDDPGAFHDFEPRQRLENNPGGGPNRDRGPEPADRRVEMSVADRGFHRMRGQDLET